jgi:hypothetical protein
MHPPPPRLCKHPLSNPHHAANPRDGCDETCIFYVEKWPAPPTGMPPSPKRRPVLCPTKSALGQEQRRFCTPQKSRPSSDNFPPLCLSVHALQEATRRQREDCGVDPGQDVLSEKGPRGMSRASAHEREDEEAEDGSPLFPFVSPPRLSSWCNCPFAFLNPQFFSCYSRIICAG